MPLTKERKCIKEKPWISVSDTSEDQLQNLKILKPSVLLPPDTVFNDKLINNNITLTLTSPNVVKNKIVDTEWKNVELDCTKITKYCLMLSKIRLTCKFNIHF